MFETTSEAKPGTESEARPGTAPLIVANTTLEQDKETVMRCWLAMGGKEDTLRRKYFNEDYDEDEDTDQDEEECLVRDEPSDEVSEWWGVVVEEGRVTGLEWLEEGLPGTIPSEIGALSALTHLNLNNNKLNGAIPSTIGALSSLTHLDLSNNYLSDVVPYSLSNLLNLQYLDLRGNNLSNGPNSNHNTKQGCQYYLNFIKRIPTIRLLNYGITITKKRQELPSTTTTTITDAFRTITTVTTYGALTDPKPTAPFFAFLTDHEHGLTDLIMSFLDPCYCCNKDRIALLKCWKSLGRAEDELRQGYGNDVARWKGVMVEDGRVVRVIWSSMGLKDNLPSEIGELDGLRMLFLFNNEISSIPSEIGKLTSLTELELGRNHLADLPRELGNLRSLTDLRLRNNRLSVLPSTLANLTDLNMLYLSNNNVHI